MAKAKTGALPGPIVKGGVPVKGKFLPPGPTTGNICRAVNLLQVYVPTTNNMDYLGCGFSGIMLIYQIMKNIPCSHSSNERNKFLCQKN